MNVFIIAALSADGFIAQDETQLADWTSKADKKLFVELTKRAGVMVMGSTTYKTIGRPLPGRRNIVYTTRTLDQDGVEATQLSPAELIKKLGGEGCEEVAICGGRSIYDQFLQAGVVNELYLTVEPILFGAGVSLLRTPAFQQLKLKATRMLNDNAVLLNYEVII